MFTHIAKSNGKLYQDGKETNKISLDDSIYDFVVIGEDSIWLNLKEK